MLRESHLLVVDDDNRIRELLSKYLNENNYIVSVARDALEARDLMKYFKFDLVLVDLMMPGENGITLTKFIKSNFKTPILMLTAMNEIENRLEGLESGAEDYLAKPFDPRELIIRIRKIIDRTKSAEHILNLTQLKYDLNTKKLLKNESPIELSDAEAKLFHLLAANFSNIISREDLSKYLRISERSVDVQIIRLRNKIEDNPKKPLNLITVRNLGYKLI